MKIRNTFTKLITITLAVAALAVADLPGGAGWVQPVAAQLGDGSVRSISYAKIGILPGDRVRFSVANPEASSGTLSLSFSYYLAHGTNSWSTIPLYQSETIRVPPREFRFADVAYEDLKIEGEPGTRRAEVLVGVSMMVPAGSDPEDFPAALEIIRDGVQDGTSTEIDSRYRLIILAAKRSSQLNVPIGFESGERLTTSIFNPNEEGSKPVRVTTYIYDSYGNTVSQTDPVDLQPGEGHTFNLNRDDLPLAGDEKTGRLQVRAGVQVLLMDGSVRPVKLHMSMEVVNRTGTTVGGSYYTGTVSVSGDG